MKCQTQLVPASRPIVNLIDEKSSGGGWRVAVAAAPVLFAVWLVSVIAYNSLGVVMDLSSGMLMSMNAFILPPLAFLRLCNPMGVSRAAAIVICFGGVVFGVT